MLSFLIGIKTNLFRFSSWEYIVGSSLASFRLGFCGWDLYLQILQWRHSSSAFMKPKQWMHGTYFPASIVVLDGLHTTINSPVKHCNCGDSHPFARFPLVFLFFKSAASFTNRSSLWLRSWCHLSFLRTSFGNKGTHLPCPLKL